MGDLAGLVEYLRANQERIHAEAEATIQFLDVVSERLRGECCGMPLDENGRCCFHRPHHSNGTRK
jgi:hypothetical protein